MSILRASACAALIPILTLAACDAAAPTESPTPHASVEANVVTRTVGTAGVERIIYEALHDLDGTELFVECADGSVSESVVLTGKIFERFAAVTNPAGGEHAVYHTMPVGLAGVGSVSGEEFRVSWRDHGVSNRTPMAMVNTFRYTIKLAGQTSKRSFELIAQGHYTLNANGEVTVGREKLEAQCE